MTVNVPGASNYEPPKPLDKGWYTIRCDKAEKTQTKSGADSLQLQLTVTDGPQQADGSAPTDPDKNTLFEFLILDFEAYHDSKGYRMIKDKLFSALNAFRVLEGDSFDVEDLVGAEADVWIKHGTDESGEPRPEIGRYKLGA